MKLPQGKESVFKGAGCKNVLKKLKMTIFLISFFFPRKLQKSQADPQWREAIQMHHLQQGFSSGL